MIKCYHKKPINQVKFSKKLKKDVLTGISRQEMFGKSPSREKMSRVEKHTHFSPLPTSIKYNPISYVESLTRSDLNTLRFSIAYGWKRGVWATQATIGKDAKISPTSVGRSHRNLALDGVLHKKHRGVKRTNFVVINPQFKRELVKPWVRRLIGETIPELGLPPAMQLSLLESHMEQNVRQLNINNSPLEVNSSYLDFFKDQTDLTSISLGQSSKQHQRKEDMSTHIPQYLFEVKSLNLTDFGRIRLSRFPQEAVEAIDNQLSQSHKDLTSPFGWFYNACKAYCTENDLQVDGMVESKLKIAYNLKSDLPALENSTINRSKRSPSQKSYGSQGNSSKGGKHKSPDVPAWVTAQSNAQAEEYEEIKQLRTVDHEAYIRRIRSKRKPFKRKDTDEETVTTEPTELNLLWDSWCQTDAGITALRAEEANPDLAGSAYKTFLATKHGQYWLGKQQPLVRQILEPLLRKNYPPEGKATDTVGPTGDVPRAKTPTLSPLEAIALWHENAVPSPSVAPYIDETSPWEEI